MSAQKDTKTVAAQKDTKTVSIEMKDIDSDKENVEIEDIETVIDMDDEDDDTDTIVIDIKGLRHRPTATEKEAPTNRDTSIDVDPERDKDEDEGCCAELMKDMGDHCKELLETTTAHGFNHLVDNGNGRSSRFSRILWGIAIFLAFFASVYYIISSVHDANQNPVATTVEYIPVQEIPFPAVTLEAEIDESSSLEDNILNQINYDCSSHTSREDALHCLNKTAAARSIINSLTVELLRAMFKVYKDIVVADEAKSNDNYIRTLTCYYIYITKMGRKILNPMVEELSEPNDDTREQKVEMYLELIGQYFKVPMELLEEEMPKMLPSNRNNKMTYFGCLQNYFDHHLSHEAKAIVILMVKLDKDKSTVTFNNWQKWKNKMNMEISSQMAFDQKFKDLQNQVSKAKENLHSGGITHEQKAESESQEMTSLATSGDNDYRRTLQRAKYNMRPLQNEMTELGRVRDIQQSLQEIDTIYNRKEATLFNFSPAMLYCKFGDNDENGLCQTTTTTFTESGLGYSLNTPSFFELYQQNPSLEIFCQEINERVGQEVCLSNGNEREQKPVFVKGNGPNFSLRFLLNIPRKDRFDWPLPKLGIHSPYSIGDTAKNFIRLSAGTHTTLVLTPHVTRLAEGLLDQSKEVRGCHYQEKDGNQLKLFRNYTKINCIYECHLEKSVQKSGCVPWNFPKLDQSIKTCSKRETLRFNEVLKQIKKSEKCLHCIDECYKIEYDFTIHTKPLENICNGEDSEEIKKSVGMVINKDVHYNFLPHDYSFQEMGPKLHLSDSCFFYANKNTALLDVYIKSSSATQITSSERVPYAQQLANLGGMAALFTGISFLTIFHFIKWLFGFPFAIGRRRRNRVGVN